MPYVPPGPSSSSQACIPRRSVVKTVLDETREKSRGLATKSRSESTSSSKRSGSVSQAEALDMSASTDALAHQLEVAHIAEPALTVDTNLAGPHAGGSPINLPSVPSSDTSLSSVSRNDSDSDLEAKRRLSSGDEAVAGYKHALYQYTRDLLRQAKDVTKEAEEKTGAFPQFGAKPSGMQRMAAKKLLARQLNA